MRKFTLTTAAVLVAVAGFSAPALAGSLASDSDAELSFDRDLVLLQLQERGIDATEVSDWGQLIKATVTLADGSSAFRYFELDTLRPVTPGGATGGNTRVLSEIDTGVARPVAPVGSLVEAESDD